MSGYELHRLERTVLTNRVVVVHAPGGMGKTALSREAARWWLNQVEVRIGVTLKTCSMMLVFVRRSFARRRRC